MVVRGRIAFFQGRAFGGCFAPQTLGTTRAASPPDPRSRLSGWGRSALVGWRLDRASIEEDHLTAITASK